MPRKDNWMDFPERIAPIPPGYIPPGLTPSPRNQPPRPTPSPPNQTPGQLPSNYFLTGGNRFTGSTVRNPTSPYTPKYEPAANTGPGMLADAIQAGDLSDFTMSNPLDYLNAIAASHTRNPEDLAEFNRRLNEIRENHRMQNISLDAQDIIRERTDPSMTGGIPLEGAGRMTQALGESLHPNAEGNARAIQEFNELEEALGQIDTSTEDGQLFSHLIQQQLQELRDSFIGNRGGGSDEFFTHIGSVADRIRSLGFRPDGPVPDSIRALAESQYEEEAAGRTQRLNPHGALGKLAITRGHLQSALSPDSAEAAQQLRADLGLGEFSESVRKQNEIDRRVEEVNTRFSRLGRFGSPEHLDAVRIAEAEAFLGDTRKNTTDEIKKINEMLGEGSSTAQNFVRSLQRRRPRNQFDRR